MSTWIKVVRFHLVDRTSYMALPWAVLTFDFVVWLTLAASAGGSSSKPIPSGALAAIYIFFVVAGMLSSLRSLPFAFALGISRRAYYAGTALLAVALAAVDGLGLALLQIIERGSGGWGVGLHFFQVAYILAGPWYLTWLTSFVLLTLMFIYGMWFGLLYWRWNLVGVLAFAAAQIVIGVIAAVTVSQADAWPVIGRFFTTLGAAGLTGLLAALVAVLLAGGYATMRRVTV